MNDFMYSKVNELSIMRHEISRSIHEMLSYVKKGNDIGYSEIILKSHYQIHQHGIYNNLKTYYDK